MLVSESTRHTNCQWYSCRGTQHHASGEIQTLECLRKLQKSLNRCHQPPLVVTCPLCKAVQRPSTCESNASIRILFELKDNKSIWLTAFKEIIIQILDTSNLVTDKHVTLLSEDVDLYLAFFMLPGPMQILYSVCTEIMSSIDNQSELP